MKNPKGDDFADRRGAAADAKAARLKAHRAALDAAEPTRLARQEERVAVAAARDERSAERERTRLEEQESADAEAAAQAAADAAAKTAAETPAKDQNDRKAEVGDNEAAKKAERDRRYAERKARKR